eukprot:CAMPEP_0202869462 /NCGR_PEP_ID=MMETSP1391-20130828/12467_1 /ASSEMBLY_ACC=CAM_ASM_000867 /TAXON_ID=1034604 /ORGANISM="Chlamydomonas leiostraca, Strain SAG 11-49" /LENGTH=134 /DNA_ID=CAMNT_0049549781 /DNA_START=201 /DNA_END=603 /DNA_ORIENTATION=-
MIEVVLNDRLGKKVRVKCNEDDTIGDLKKLVAAQTGTRPDKIRIQKWYTIYKDHITLADYEIHDGMGLELYYNKSSTGSCSSTGVQLQQSVACQCTAQLVLHADGDDREHVAASCIQPGATHAVAAVHGAAVGR